jgi:hypothetical protein
VEVSSPISPGSELINFAKYASVPRKINMIGPYGNASGRPPPANQTCQGLKIFSIPVERNGTNNLF